MTLALLALWPRGEPMDAADEVTPLTKADGWRGENRERLQ